MCSTTPFRLATCGHWLGSSYSSQTLFLSLWIVSERASVSSEPLARHIFLSVLSWFLRQVPGLLVFIGPTVLVLCSSGWADILKMKIDEHSPQVEGHVLSFTHFQYVTYSPHSRHRISFIYLYMTQHTNSISYGYVYAYENNTAP